MRRIWIAVAVAAVSLAALGTALAWGGSSQPAGDPARFLSSVIHLLAANRYGEAWQMLDPRDRALAPKRVYVACESQSPIPGHLASLRVLGRSRDRIGIVVRFALRIVDPAMPQGVAVHVTAHAVAVHGRWAWILPPARRTRYRNGCGPGAAPAA